MVGTVERMVRIFIFITLLLFTHIASAQIVISELMYDVSGADTGREWIEVENIGYESLDFTTWKLYENEINHAIKESKGKSVLSSGDFAILADNAKKFLIDYPDFPGIIFESAFSLNNDGETIGLKDMSGNLVHQLSYTKSAGAAGNGASFQKIAGVWHAALPTPGFANTAAAAEKQELKPYTILPEYSGNTTVGSELLFKVKIDGGASGGKVFWNFGDGDTLSDTFDTEVGHRYRFAGTYAVVAAHRPDEKNDVAVSESMRITISDAPPAIVEEIARTENIRIETPVITDEPEAAPQTTVTEPEILTASAAESDVHFGWWIVALLGLMVVGVWIVLLFNHKETEPTVADEYEIIE